MGRRPDRTTNRATDRYGEGGREATLVVLLVIGGVFVVLGVGQSSGTAGHGRRIIAPDRALAPP